MYNRQRSNLQNESPYYGDKLKMCEDENKNKKLKKEIKKRIRTIF